jgi:hypothetical protein
MTESVGVGGSWKTVTGQWVGVVSAWKRVVHKWVGVGGVWELVYSALSVSAANALGNNSGFASSGSVTAVMTAPTVLYGSVSYSYLWTHVSTASGGTPSITLSTTATPHFNATVSDPPGSAVSTWKVVVTDTVYGGSEEDTATVTLTWTNLT